MIKFYILRSVLSYLALNFLQASYKHFETTAFNRQYTNSSKDKEENEDWSLHFVVSSSLMFFFFQHKKHNVLYLRSGLYCLKNISLSCKNYCQRALFSHWICLCSKTGPIFWYSEHSLLLVCAMYLVKCVQHMWGNRTYS